MGFVDDVPSCRYRWKKCVSCRRRIVRRFQLATLYVFQGDRFTEKDNKQGKKTLLKSLHKDTGGEPGAGHTPVH
jgi:hypothetical protein